MKTNTLLLDLDGTLSYMDKKVFTKTYLTALGKRLSDLIPVEIFLPQVLASTEVMVRSQDGRKTNIDAFMNDFSMAVDVDKEILWPIFIDFYANEFPKFGYLVEPNPLSQPLVKLAIAKGFTVAIACNPVMPKVAILERIKWTGVSIEDLAFVPSIEEMKFCKPNPNFFMEIVNHLGKKPAECLMVGNEPLEDMTAKRVGIKTYLITEEYNNNVECDYQGNLDSLFALIKEEKI